ncbi:nucleotidyltransferase domain-containing protein, partial [Endothiovibrio diazotrophicus]
MTSSPTHSPDGAPRCLTNTLDHLPEAKRYQLERIKEVLCSTVPLDWLVLFGSYARGDWVEDPIHRYFSDYDLLVVVSEPFLVQRAGLWERLERELQAIAGRVPVTLLVHTHKEVNHEIRMGQYFFCDIMNEGVVLYDGHRSQF